MCLPLLAILPAILGPALSALGSAAGAVGLGGIGASLASAGASTAAAAGTGFLGLGISAQTALGVGSLVAAGVSTGVSTAQANAAADAQEDLSNQQFQAESAALSAQSEQQRQASAEENLAIAETAAKERGELQNTGLADASLAQFLVDTNRSQGRALAVAERNLEFAGEAASIRRRSSELSSAGRLLQIDRSRPSGLTVGASLLNTTAGAGLNLGGLNLRRDQTIASGGRAGPG